jgi:hypothetical protein
LKKASRHRIESHGGLEDKLAKQLNLNRLITVVPTDDEERIVEVFIAALSVNERGILPQSFVSN